jgi:hypothetical protein
MPEPAPPNQRDRQHLRRAHRHGETTQRLATAKLHIK